MARLTPVSHRELVVKLRKLGFDGPFSGGKHLLMTCGAKRIVIPNIHGPAIGIELLARILRHAGISREDWDATE